MATDDFQNTVKTGQHKVQNLNVKVFQSLQKKSISFLSEVSWAVLGPNQTHFQWEPALFPP
jgi:hypothetical protein